MNTGLSFTSTIAVQILFRPPRVFWLTVLHAFFVTSAFAATGPTNFWVGTVNGATVSVPSGGNWDNTTTAWNNIGSGMANTVWGPNGGTNAVFGGADGNYGINVSGSVANPLSLQFNASGYTLSNTTTPRSISFNAGGGIPMPNVVVAAGKTATIGTNITLSLNATFILGGGGILVIDNGGTCQLTSASTLSIDSNLTVSVKTGGSFKMTATGTATSGNLQIGAASGENATLSVDGGSVSLAGTNNQGILIGEVSGAIGTLTINAGAVSQPASANKVLSVGFAPGSTGTVNLNGGLLAVSCVTNGPGTGTFNFNGGRLKAVNNYNSSTFLSSITTANVQAGGAVIDNNGFDITIPQQLLNSGGVDGGLTLTNSGIGGSLTLTSINTYNGNTVVDSGRLALSGGGSIANSADVVVAGGAIFDVSALGSFALASGQILSNSTSTATLNGNLNASAGKVSLTYVLGAPSFAVTNGTLTLSSSTPFIINNTGSALPAGSYKLIDANAGSSITGGLPPVAVVGSGLVSGATAGLQITSGDLYLTVSGGIFGIDPADATPAINAFNAAFLTIYNGGHSAAYITALNDTSRDYFWSEAEDIQGEENVFEHTGNPTDQMLVSNLCATFLVNWAPPWSWDTWNDDVGRVSQMLIRGYQMTGNANFLNSAESGFNLVYSRGWDTTFNGGGIYEQQGVTNPKKETLSTATTGHAAAMIYQNGGGAIYLTQAEQIYGWLRANLFNTTSGAVYTGVYTNGTVDTATQIYNQGLFIDYANCLYEITGNPMYFNDANLAVQYTQLHLTSNGILPSAAGEFVRGMGHFVTYNNLWSTYYSWMRSNASAAWACRRTDLNIAWNIWTTQTPMTNTLTPLECLGVVGILQFTPPTQPGFVACSNQLTGTIIGSTPGGGNTITNVFDGNLSTYFFAASSSGAWVGLDLGTSNIIGQINYCPRPNWASLMIGGVFQGDNDPSFSTSVTLYTITTVPPQYMMTPIMITNQTAFRYMRYVGPPGANCNVAELQFYGPNAKAPITLQWNSTLMQLNWSGNGMLLEATNLSGPWATNTSAVSPFQVVPSAPQKFFRVQSQ